MIKTLSSKLLQIKAIKINVQNIFVWASGIKSPIYCDNRMALSDCATRSEIKNGFVELSKKYVDIDIIAGVATAGIPWGTLLADALNLPFAYVRSSAKKHGRQNLIEGKIQAGQKVLVVEDLISTGGSSIKAVDAIRENGSEVVGVLAIFTYNLPKAKENFDKANCKFETLTDYDTLIDAAKEKEYISPKDFEMILDWKNDPENWYNKHFEN